MREHKLERGESSVALGPSQKRKKDGERERKPKTRQGSALPQIIRKLPLAVWSPAKCLYLRNINGFGLPPRGPLQTVSAALWYVAPSCAVSLPETPCWGGRVRGGEVGVRGCATHTKEDWRANKKKTYIRTYAG